MIILELWGKPIVKKRHRSRGKIQYDPQSKEKVHTEWQMKAQWPNPPIESPLIVTFKFYISPPKNTSFVKKKGMYNNVIKCVTKGDLSNFIKYYEDCGNGILWTDDRLIWGYGAGTARYWGEEEKTLITIHGENDVISDFC